MNGRSPRGCGAYARSLEEALSRIQGRPVVLSPRDWSLASDWFERGIPLAAVTESLDEAARRARKRGRSAGPRSLAYVAAAVEESWELVRMGRARAASSRRGRSMEEVRAAWQRAAERAGETSPLGRLLLSSLEGLGAHATPADVDQALDEGLLDSVPATARASIESEVASDIEPFRSRMSEEAFESTRRRAVIERLRRSLGLPHLASADPDA